MAGYILTWSDPSKTPITVLDNTSDSSTTSLTLTGRGFVNWGLPLQENILHLLENFASPSAPLVPVIGQAWFNKTLNRLSIQTTSSAWEELAWRRVDSSTPPTGPYDGDTWFDTVNKYLNVYDSSVSSWQELAFRGQTMGNYTDLDSGTANAYVVAIDTRTITSNFVGRFKASNSNSGSSTIDFGLGPIPLLNNFGASLTSNQITAGSIITYLYVVSDNKAYVLNSIGFNDSRYLGIHGTADAALVATSATNATNLVALGTISSSVTGATQTLGDNTSKIATTQFVQANATNLIQQLSLGFGQSWQDMTSSRTAGVTYTNTTGKPIAWSITCMAGGSGGGGKIYVDGIQISNTGNPSGSADQNFVIVPPGSTYSFTQTGNPFSLWIELR